MTAPEGDSLTPQELIALLGKARIKVDDWGVVSEEPLHIEATLEGQGSILSARGTEGRLRLVSIENPQDRILARFCPVLERRGWEIDGD